MTAASQKRHGGTKGEEEPEENPVPSSRNSWRHTMLKHGGRVKRNVCNRI